MSKRIQSPQVPFIISEYCCGATSIMNFSPWQTRRKHFWHKESHSRSKLTKSSKNYSTEEYQFKAPLTHRTTNKKFDLVFSGDSFIINYQHFVHQCFALLFYLCITLGQGIELSIEYAGINELFNDLASNIT